MTVPNRTLLIDADILIWQISASELGEFEFSPGVWSSSMDIETAKQKLDNRIREWTEKLGAGAVIMCLSDKQNFRKTVLPSYKSNRKSRKPLGYSPLRQYVEKAYKTACWPGLEADDVMGILQMSKKANEETVIVSSDKDMMTIPGLLYRMNNEDIMFITNEYADYMWMTQTLTGDSTDGYKGCPGVGRVKAAKLLAEGQSVEEMWETVVEAFGAQTKDEDADPLVQARLARILRKGDYDRKNSKIKLWSPA